MECSGISFFVAIKRIDFLGNVWYNNHISDYYTELKSKPDCFATSREINKLQNLYRECFYEILGSELGERA